MISGAEGSRNRPVSDAANGSDCKYIGYAGGGNESFYFTPNHDRRILP